MVIKNITIISTVRIYSNDYDDHRHGQELNSPSIDSTCEVNTITCPIPRTRPFEWVSNSVELVHIHKLKLSDDSSNIGDTQPWSTLANCSQSIKSDHSRSTNQLITLDGARIASVINLSPTHTGSSDGMKSKAR
jgi:hypothetical protein